MRASVLGPVVAIVFGLGFVSVAWAQTADIQIVQLDCNSEPEQVVVQNLGDAEQDLSGWKLESDPPDLEVFSLFSVLQPGESTSIALGQQSLFRDDDPTDYARIVDATGAVVHQVNCAGGAVPGASPTPTPGISPTPSPAPSAAPSPAVDVPNGGGPPPVDAAVSPLVVALAGGAMLAIGLTVFALPRLRATSSPALGHALSTGPLNASVSKGRPQPIGRRDHPDKADSLASRLTLLGLAATLAFIIVSSLRQRGSD